MAVEITEDVVEGSGMEITPDGLFYRRVLTVKGLSQTPASNFHFRAYAAIFAATPRNQFGGDHPTIPGLLCERVQAFPLEKAKSSNRVLLLYRDLYATRIRVNGTLTRDTTRYDKDGNILEIRYSRANGSNMSFVPSTDNSEPDYAEVPVQVPGTIVEWERYEDSTTNGQGTPFQVADKFQTRLNSTPFMGKPKHTWQFLDCTGARFGNEIIGGYGIWLYRYSMQFIGFNIRGIHETFDPVIIWTEKQSRRVPQGMNPRAGGFPATKRGNGWRQVEISPEADFNVLALPTIIA